jgi:hypothetical protein
MAADSRWQAFVQKMKDMDILLRLKLRIMRPTNFSSLR